MNEFIAGTMGGLCGVVVGHPFDTIKIRLQTGATTGGAWSVLSQIVRTESPAALYKGMLSPMIGEAANNCILFGVYGMLKPFQERHNHSSASVAISGALAGTAISVVVCPSELVKTQLQNNRDSFRFRSEGFAGCVSRIVRDSGPLGLFHGYRITLAREIVFNACYFFIYEHCKRLLVARRQTAKETVQATSIDYLLAGGLAGTGAWALSYPIDVAKTCIQARSDNFVLENWREYGFRFFYRGFWTTIFRSFPVNAVTFWAYEWTLGALR